MDDEFGKFGGLLCNFSDASGCVFANLDIDVFKAVKNLGEDFGFNDDFGQIYGVLCDLS